MVIHGIHDYQSLMNGYQCFLVRQSDLFNHGWSISGDGSKPLVPW